MNTLDSWKIQRMRGGSGTITHSWITNAPGCPPDRHPTRWCACKVHKTKTAAEQYVTEQETTA